MAWYSNRKASKRRPVWKNDYDSSTIKRTRIAGRRRGPFKRLLGAFRKITVILVTFFLIFELFSSLILSSAQISSISMEPNYSPGDRVLISRLTYGMLWPFSDRRISSSSVPQRGHVVVLKAPYSRGRHLPVLRDLRDFFTLNSSFLKTQTSLEEGYLLRRIIALPGDRVYLSGGNAFVQIEGQGEFYMEGLDVKKYQLNLPKTEFNRPDMLNNYYMNAVVVKPGEFFVLPDNRAEAIGSESWGSVSFESLRGRAFIILPRLRKG